MLFRSRDVYRQALQQLVRFLDTGHRRVREMGHGHGHGHGHEPDAVSDGAVESEATPSLPLGAPLIAASLASFETLPVVQTTALVVSTADRENV